MLELVFLKKFRHFFKHIYEEIPYNYLVCNALQYQSQAMQRQPTKNKFMNFVYELKEFVKLKYQLTVMKTFSRIRKIFTHVSLNILYILTFQ